MIKKFLLISLFFLSCSASTSNVDEKLDVNTIVVGDELIYKVADTVPDPTLFNNFVVKDMDGNSFDLYAQLEKKAVIVLYTDILNDVNNVLAFEEFVKNNDTLYSPIIMDLGNELELLQKEIKDKKYTTRIFLDSNRRMYKEFNIEHVSTSIVIGKDKFIKAFIKRDINSVEVYEDMLRGVVK